MEIRPIDANQLYRIEKLLDTDIVKKDKVASELLEQVLYDIQHIPTLTPPNEWVSVETEMPKEPGHYLVVLDRKAPEDLGGDKKMVRIMRFRLDGKFQYPAHFPAWINDEIEENVTHWMPLPEAPDSRPPEGEG